jgi:hypothetical protein
LALQAEAGANIKQMGCEEAMARAHLLDLCAAIAVQSGFALPAPETDKLRPAIGGPDIEP